MGALTRKKKKEVVARARQVLKENMWARGKWITASRELRARTKVTETGCCGAYQMAKKVQLIGANKEETCSFCVQGALYAAAATCGLDPDEAHLLVQNAELAARDHPEVANGRSLMSFNDSLPSEGGCRSKDEMLEVLERLEKVI